MRTRTAGSRPANWRPNFPAGKSDERGSTTVFTLGLVIVVLLLIVVVTSAASVHLERKRLWNLTDSIALEVSDALTLQTHMELEVGAREVRSTIDDALARLSSPEVGSERITVGPRTDFSEPDRVTVHLVTAHRPGPLPWILAPWSEGIVLEAAATTVIAVPN